MLYSGLAAFMGGIWWGLQGELSSFMTLKLLLFLSLFSFLLIFSVTKTWLRVFCFAFFCCVLGVTNAQRVGLSAEQRLTPYMQREVCAEGSVDVGSVRKTEEGYSLLLACERLYVGSESVAYDGRLRLRLTAAALGAVGAEGLRAERLTVSGVLSASVALHNPGGFDAERYNRVQNIGAVLSKARVVRVERSDSRGLSLGRGLWAHMRSLLRRWSWFGYDLRERWRQRLRHGELVGGMLLGGSGNLDEETRDIFTANGLNHLLSVSGTHILLISVWLTALLRPLPCRWRKYPLVLCLTAYALLCGLRAPVLRALLVTAALLFGGRGAERGRLLCLAAFLLLSARPLWLLDMGFQLSFAAAAGLVLLLTACERVLPEAWPDFLREGLGVTMAAQLACLPFLTHYFHQLPLLALLSNPLLVPVLELAPLISGVGLALERVGGVFTPLSQYALELSDLLLSGVLAQGRYLAALPFANPVVGELPLWCAPVYYAALLAWADAPCARFLANAERRALLCVSLCLLMAALAWPRLTRQELEVYFLDVGQGDCVVLIAPDRRTYIYDTGGLSYLDTGKRVIAPFLRSRGITRVEALLLSHYDSDHVGGAVGVLRNVRVRELVLPREQAEGSSASLRKTILAVARARGVRVSVAREGRAFELGEGCTLRLALATPAAVSGNAASTVALLNSPWGRLLLTGDLSSEEEGALSIPPCTVLKAGHHGSRYSNGEELLAQARPRYAVISCGAGNVYGHPHEETLARLAAAGAQVWRTDLDGCVRVRFFAAGVRCEGYRRRARSTFR